MFLRTFGDIVEVRVAFDQDGTNKGFGYVEFNSSDTVKKVLAVECATISG